MRVLLALTILGLGAAKVPKHLDHTHDDNYEKHLDENFKKWDKNGDGKLSQTEVEDRVVQVAKDIHAKDKAHLETYASTVLKTLTSKYGADPNGDGKVSLAEMKTAYVKVKGAGEEEWEKLNCNGVDWEGTVWARRPGLAEWFTFADENKDGKLESHEFVELCYHSTAPWKRSAERAQQFHELESMPKFNHIDKDRDGKLSPAEIKASNPNPGSPLSDAANGSGVQSLSAFAELEYPHAYSSNEHHLLHKRAERIIKGHGNADFTITKSQLKEGMKEWQWIRASLAEYAVSHVNMGDRVEL